MLSLPFACFISLLFLSLAQFGQAILVNFTIDDTIPDSNHEAVTYDPPAAWNSQDFCPHAPCFVRPDVTRIQGGTWHESLFHAESSFANDFANRLLTATAIFYGSAVYVYAVLPLVNGTLPSTSAISFILDGESTGPFSHTSGSDYTYNFLAFMKTGLLLGSHNITIVNGKINGENSLFILDSIVYSTTINDSILSQSPPEIISQPTETPSTQSIGHLNLSSFSSRASVGPEVFVPTPTPGGSTQTVISSGSGGAASTNFNIPTTPLSPISSPAGDGNAAPGRSLSTGAIVGAVLGPLVGVVAIILLGRHYRYRRRIRVDRRTMSSFGSPSSMNLVTETFHPYPDRDSIRWPIASDSKRDILEQERRPPVYHRL